MNLSHCATIRHFFGRAARRGDGDGGRPKGQKWNNHSCMIDALLAYESASEDIIRVVSNIWFNMVYFVYAIYVTVSRGELCLLLCDRDMDHLLPKWPMKTSI